MATRYEFRMIEEDENSFDAGREITHVVMTDDPTWLPVLDEFFNFLKGAGFLFDTGSQIDVINNDGDSMREKAERFR